MIKVKNQKIRNRKVMAKSQYQLPDIPDIDDNRYILDSEYEQEQEESTQNWLGSMSEKSQYNITELLCVNW